MLDKVQRCLQELPLAVEVGESLHESVLLIGAEIKADAVALYLINHSKGIYQVVAENNIDPDSCFAKKYNLGEGLIGLVGRREEAINIENILEHEDRLANKSLGNSQQLNFIGVPVFDQGELLAIFVALRSKDNLFTEDNEASLVTICSQLGSPLGMMCKKHSFFANKASKKDMLLEGLSGSTGVAIGKAVVVYPPADLEAVPNKTIKNIDKEIESFELALRGARDEMAKLQLNAKTQLSDTESVLFDVYLRMLDSRSLMNEVVDEIKQNIWAPAALRNVIRRHSAKFEALDDHYLRERAADFRDLGHRILAHLQKPSNVTVDFEENTILVSEEVTATSLMEMPEGCLIGIVSGSGSGNSHLAILARAMGIPIVMSVAGVSLDQLSGKELILDGYNGQVFVSPSKALKKEYRQLIAEEDELDDRLASLRDTKAITPDGKEFGLYVNTGLASDGGMSLSAGAEGIGLYRTELPFMMREKFPSEKEQRIMYKQLLNAFSPRPVVMRTLDIGGDKVLPYFPLTEENPFLGWRGIRISLDHPDIFLQQLRAMLQASEGMSNLSLLLPMITTMHEVEVALSLIDQAYSEVVAEGFVIKMPKIGLMIEVPAAVYQAYDLALRVDFLSVGSNDLIQYILAVDRNNPRVAEMYDGLHPAVLGALYAVVKAGRKANRPVSICGEMAADPLSVVLLIGMGFDVLSLNARFLARTKWVIQQIPYEDAKAITKEVLQMTDAADIKMHMENILDDAGLGALIRAGQ